jgi:hypothetical protein
MATYTAAAARSGRVYRMKFADVCLQRGFCAET